MIYAVFFIPESLQDSLLAKTHHFNDSKVLSPVVRSSLVQTLCTPGSDLFENCGWATRVMSAQDISAGMLKAGVAYNLNAQAMDATIMLISDVLMTSIKLTSVCVHLSISTLGAATPGA